ncbi:hypothetical protein NIES22_14400 [Calothrix brevissima NIES-22]|nr:hypothetical protein NIES22_14400 [Calothrix brevissima NIES-22]
MKRTQWINNSIQHPTGVGEGATATWLKKINDKGVAIANQITATECDGLQALCESGKFILAKKLDTDEDHISLETYDNHISFDALNGNTLKDKGTPKDSVETGVFKHLEHPGDFIYITLKDKGTSKDSVETGVFEHLEHPGDFIYISASNPGGHAMALYI